MKNTVRLLVLVLAAAALLTGCARSAPQQTVSEPLPTEAPAVTPAPETTPAASGEPTQETEPEGPADAGIDGLNAPPEAAPIYEVPEDPGAANAGQEGIFTSEAQGFSVAYDSSCRPALAEDGSVILYLTDADSVPCVEIRRVSGWDAAEYLISQLSELKAEHDVMMDSGSADTAVVGDMEVPSTWANYTEDGTMITMLAYARDMDGDVLSCAAFFDEITAARAMEIVENALLTAEPVGSGAAPAPEAPAEDEEAPAEAGEAPAAEAAPAQTGGQGDWTYTVTTLPDGGEEYAIGELSVTIPASWAGKYEIGYYGDGMSFYHTASRQMWRQTGLDGGVLFTLGRTDDPDSISYLPHADDLGAASDGTHYFIEYPTDVQGFYEDDSVMTEYTALYASIDFVTEHAHVAG